MTETLHRPSTTEEDTGDRDNTWFIKEQELVVTSRGGYVYISYQQKMRFGRNDDVTRAAVRRPRAEGDANHRLDAQRSGMNGIACVSLDTDLSLAARNSVGGEDGCDWLERSLGTV